MEAELLQELLATDYPNMKYWISFQCKDSEKLAHGESFGTTINELWTKSKQLPNHSNLIALGVNCTHPSHIASLFKSVNGSRASQEQIPFVVYPNSGEVYQASDEWVFFCITNLINRYPYIPSSLNIERPPVGLAKTDAFRWKLMWRNGLSWESVLLVVAAAHMLVIFKVLRERSTSSDAQPMDNNGNYLNKNTVNMTINAGDGNLNTAFLFEPVY